MLVKRFGKAASPICGVVADVAPGGAQTTNPVSQSPLEFNDDTEPSVARIASTTSKRTSGLMLIAIIVERF